MKVFLVIVMVFMPVVAYAACTGSSPNWYCNTSTCSAYTDLNSCITGATNGDTITFSAGTYTYSGSISLNKPVSVIGAGVDVSYITGGSTLSITPSSYTDTTNLYRVSGFTFTGGRSINRLGTDYWNVTSDKPALPKVRVDHNKFIGTGAGSSPQWVYNSGTMQGVIDHNTVQDYGYPVRNLPGVDYTARALARFQYVYPHWDTGNDYVIMFEDNTITGVDYGTGDSIFSDSGVGGVFAFRYNTITADTPGSPLFDWHGYTSGQASSFAGEVYGNQITASGSFIRARGGKAMMHHNRVSQSMAIQYYSGISSGDTNACPAEYTEAQMMHDTYSFLNRVGATGSLLSNSTTFTIGGTCLGKSGIPEAGRDYFYDSSSPGVSCGTLAALPGTCTTGQGYWATNQSCTDLTGMTGANPTTPISGTLYKCTATDTWTSFYTPLTYPHPLIADSDPIAQGISDYAKGEWLKGNVKPGSDTFKMRLYDTSSVVMSLSTTTTCSSTGEMSGGSYAAATLAGATVTTDGSNRALLSFSSPATFTGLSGTASGAAICDDTSGAFIGYWMFHPVQLNGGLTVNTPTGVIRLP